MNEELWEPGWAPVQLGELLGPGSSAPAYAFPHPLGPALSPPNLPALLCVPPILWALLCVPQPPLAGCEPAGAPLLQPKAALGAGLPLSGLRSRADREHRQPLGGAP